MLFASTTPSPVAFIPHPTIQISNQIKTIFRFFTDLSFTVSTKITQIRSQPLILAPKSPGTPDHIHPCPPDYFAVRSSSRIIFQLTHDDHKKIEPIWRPSFPLHQSHSLVFTSGGGRKSMNGTAGGRRRSCFTLFCFPSCGGSGVTRCEMMLWIWLWGNWGVDPALDYRFY